MSTATVEPKKSEAKLSQLKQLKEIHGRGRGHGRLRIDQGFQTARRDDEPESDLRGDAKVAVRSFAARSADRSEEIGIERRGAGRSRHHSSSSGAGDDTRHVDPVSHFI